MPVLELDGLRPVVSQRLKPFVEDVFRLYEEIHSVQVVGSALTEDYDEKKSDINTIFVLNKMDLGFLEILAPKGKKYRKSGLAAPLIMTQEYVENSLDVFPVEFLSFREIHHTVFGPDIISGLEIISADLRSQCEREVKSKLIGLRQGYLSAMGDASAVAETFKESITGYIPLFRGIVFLLGRGVPRGHAEVIGELDRVTGVDCEAFSKVLDMKKKGVRPGKDELDRLFEDYYIAAEGLGKVVDEISH